MTTCRGLLLAGILGTLSLCTLACGGEDERETPNCDLVECFTQPDGGVPLGSDGGSD